VALARGAGLPSLSARAAAATSSSSARRIREMRGFDMTQAEFARRVGISQNYLSTMERGQVEIGAEILLRIAREFGKSIEWLLTGEG